MSSNIVGRPPTDQYCGGGGGGWGGGVVPCFSSNARCMHGVESRVLAIMLLQRAGGRRRWWEEGIAINDSGHPGSYDNKHEVDALLHHLGY